MRRRYTQNKYLFMNGLGAQYDGLFFVLRFVINIIHKMQSSPAVNYFYSQAIFLKHDFRKKL